MGAKPTKLATTQIVPSQWAYLLVMNGVGAAFLNTAINATLAYVLNMNTESLSVWNFDPTPIAGDFAVTIFIQQTLTWILMGNLVCKDVRNGVVAPLASPPPRILKTRLGWLTKIEDNFLWEGRSAFFLKTRRNLFRAALFAITSFLVFWPPAVLIVSLIEKENGRMDVVPWYIITKGVFAFMISIPSPLVAYFALRSMGMKQHDPVAGDPSYTGSPRVSVVVPGQESIVDQDKEGLKSKDLNIGPSVESVVADS